MEVVGPRCYSAVCMENRYVDAEAARVVSERPPHVSELLALRTYTARRLGADQALVLHGGGNTSVKAEAKTVFGESVSVLHVKGSGWDLATIERPGHPAVRMASLERLLTLPEMTDEQMVNEMRLALLDASAPTPSVETLLHAALPARFIDHAHADAILSIADQEAGEAICREVFGDALLWVPCVMPGFGLAKACKKAWDGAAIAGRSPRVMVLERHGLFTFGETAKESYASMIDAVTCAERFAAGRRPAANVTAVQLDDALEARVATLVRGALATTSRGVTRPSQRARAKRAGDRRAVDHARSIGHRDCFEPRLTAAEADRPLPVAPARGPADLGSAPSASASSSTRAGVRRSGGRSVSTSPAPAPAR